MWGGGDTDTTHTMEEFIMREIFDDYSHVGTKAPYQMLSSITSGDSKANTGCSACELFPDTLYHAMRELVSSTPVDRRLADAWGELPDHTLIEGVMGLPVYFRPTDVTLGEEGILAVGFQDCAESPYLLRAIRDVVVRYGRLDSLRWPLTHPLTGGVYLIFRMPLSGSWADSRADHGYFLQDSFYYHLQFDLAYMRVLRPLILFGRLKPPMGIPDPLQVVFSAASELQYAVPLSVPGRYHMLHPHAWDGDTCPMSELFDGHSGGATVAYEALTPPPTDYAPAMCGSPVYIPSSPCYEET